MKTGARNRSKVLGAVDEMNPVRLSVIVPIYNEQLSVAETARTLESVAASIDGAAEVIFVDDGSDDGTAAELGSLEGNCFRVVRHEENLGYGAALKTGLREARAELVAITDADGTCPAARLPELLQEMEAAGADMIVGARVGPEAKVPLVRRPAKWLLNLLANALAGKRIPDLNSGLRIMKRGAVERFLNILPDGFSFTTTITLAMLTKGYRVRFTPIDYHPRKGRSKIRPLRDTLNFIQLICRTTLYFNPLRIFVPASLALAALAVLVLVGSRLFLDRIMDVTFGVILMTAVMVLAIGMLADLIDKRTES